jgi:mRNA interferase RelE/StbE
VASWKAEFTPAARRQFERLDRSVQRRIQNYLNDNVLAGDPRRFGRALRGDLSGLWRYRVGDFRLIAKLEDAILTAVIIKTGHRSVIYED